MRVSKAQAEENRNRIVATAGRLFREKGFDGIGVADLMKAAGLTHGGFYGHFASKEDLAAKATAQALAKGRAYWDRLIADGQEDAFARIIRLYLSDLHREMPGKGCVLAALGAETARQGGPVRAALTEGVKGLIATLASVAPGETEAARSETALLGFAQMVGAIILARAIDDRALSDHILSSVAAALTARDQAG